MKIAVIGASGFVGSHIVTEALERGYQVTAIARNTDNIKTQHANLTVKKGDVFNPDEIAKIVSGHDAVISAYNAGWQNPNLYEDFIKGSQAIQQGVKKSGVKRLITVGGAGSLEVAPEVQLVDSPQFPAEWKPGALAARDYLNIIRKEEELDWTFFSPAIEMHHGIKDGRLGKYRLGTDQPVFDEKGVSRLSPEDVAVVLLDELTNKKFIRKRFTAAY